MCPKCRGRGRILLKFWRLELEIGCKECLGTGSNIKDYHQELSLGRKVLVWFKDSHKEDQEEHPDYGKEGKIVGLSAPEGLPRILVEVGEERYVLFPNEVELR